MTPMAAAAIGYGDGGQCGLVGWGRSVNKDNASTKATTTMTMSMERTLTTKERDGNQIPPGDTAQMNRYQ
jgi:hypothetical protein